MAAGLVDEGVGRAATRRPRPTAGAGCASVRARPSSPWPARLTATTRRGAPRGRAAAARGSGAAGPPSWAARAEAEELAADVELGRTGAGAGDRGDRLAAELERQGLRWGAVDGAARTWSASCCGAASRTRRGRRLPRHPRSGRPRRSRSGSLDRDVRAELAAARARGATRCDHLRAGPRRPARVAELVRVAWTCRPTWSGTASGWRCAGWRWRCESRSDAVLFEWSERARMLASRGSSRCGRRRTSRSSPTWPSCGAGAGAPEREAELRRRVRERAWQHRGSGEVADPVAAGRAPGRRWATDTALVAYVVTADARGRAGGHDGRHAPARPRRTARGSTTLLGGLLPDLDMAASDLPDALAGSCAATLARRLDALAALLVDSAARRPRRTPASC